jgi:cell division protein FtsQ
MQMPFVLPGRSFRRPAARPRGRLPGGRGLRRLPGGLAARLSAALASGRVRRWALLGLALLALLLGGWLWLRSSSLVAVERVEIADVRGPQAAQIDAALSAAARRMTTLRFDKSALRAAVASFPVVESVQAATRFPHGVKITVHERPPVAMLAANGQRTAVAADGTVLGQALLSSALPLLHGPVVPPVGARVADQSTLAAVVVLGAAPARLARFVARVYVGPEGLTVAMRNGLLVYFGDSSRPHAKWLSLASVLADPSSAGVSYVDVRVPSRPAAGHSEGTLQTHALSGSAQRLATTGVAANEAAAAALAERLASTVGMGASSGSGSTSESERTAVGGEGSGEEHASESSGGASAESPVGASEGGVAEGVASEGAPAAAGQRGEAFAGERAAAPVASAQPSAETVTSGGAPAP